MQSETEAVSSAAPCSVAISPSMAADAEEMHRVPPCFDWLRQQIESDMSPDVIFLYGLTDSVLPFGSSAVIQISSSEVENDASDDAASHFLLAQLIDRHNSLFEDQMDKNALPGKGLRLLALLSPPLTVNQVSKLATKDLLCKFLSGSTEDYVISSLHAFVERKSTNPLSLNFFGLVGFPSFSVSTSPSCLRHPNISPLLGLMNGPSYSYLLHPKAPFSLENILHYSSYALKSDWQIRFLIYQILSALLCMHNLGIAHGSLCPSSILLSNSLWIWLSLPDLQILREKTDKNCHVSLSCVKHHAVHCPCEMIYPNLKLSASMDWYSNFLRWWKGELSNYEYLLVLNKLAGRRWGDHTFHTVMPWVIDFSVKPDENSDIGWRDLQKSKWRLAKGDEQLDFTYSTSEIPHHVSDECLSELAVCSYKARRLPLKILRAAVRSVYEPNEYPSSMQRLYQWTPDECIPEFYSDPRIFSSIHSEMNDLAVPSWASSPEDFILLHRNALESERVARQIHHWIDITFGYKLSGEPAIAAKNVMLPLSDPLVPRSMGRRQLFTRPHPMRQASKFQSGYSSSKKANTSMQRQKIEGMSYSNESSGIDSALLSSSNDFCLSESNCLENLEEAVLFCEAGRFLNPVYSYDINSIKFPEVDIPHGFHSKMDDLVMHGRSSVPCDLGLGHLLDFFESDDDDSSTFQDLMRWRYSSSSSVSSSEVLAEDIFSIGCIIAELYLKRPLFDRISLNAYKENDVLPEAMQELPPSIVVLVEAAIQRDWKRRISARYFLESPYFSPSVRGVYLFLAPLQLLSRPGYRLQYAAKLASEGALKAMGPYATEKCVPYILPLVMTALSDSEAESAMCLLKEFFKCLNSRATRKFILPIIQKILQASEYSHLKVSILQESFVHDLWKQLGKQAYLENIHPSVISNLCNSLDKVSVSVAAVVLIGCCEEVGIPITIHQTILPVVHSFGKGLSSDGIDALVRIGELLGENFIVRQLIPLARNIVIACTDASFMTKPEPIRSWVGLAIIDSFHFLDGLGSLLPPEVFLRELIQNEVCLHVKVLMQAHFEDPVIKATASALIGVCWRLGPEQTASYIIPQLKKIFEELAFSQPTASAVGSSGRSSETSRTTSEENFQNGNRMDIVFILYPSLAQLMGIERLRHCCSTWFILEQILKRDYCWQWNSIGEPSRNFGGQNNAQCLNVTRISSSDYNPAKLLLNGVGWSVPQSKGVQGGMAMMSCSKENELQKSSFRHSTASSNGQNEPWFWFLGTDVSRDLPDFLGRTCSIKDELPWKIKACILYSARAHPGVLRSVAVFHDETTIYSGGVGPGFKGSIQKWELPRMNCISGYYGHDEVVNSICVLSVNGRIASSDGTIHIWNGQSGKLVATYAESSVNFPQHSSTSLKVTAEQMNVLTPYSLSGGLLPNAFNGNLYTCMHHLEFNDKLIAGLGNGSVRFIDILRDQKLHLWKTDAAEYSCSSLVSCICSGDSEKFSDQRTMAPPSWIAVGLSTGYCRLLDARSGSVVTCWRAHDGYITKLAAPENHLLVSSSLDKTLRVWDLRRNLPSQANVFRGHQDGISSFSVWGQDVISISRNKIAVSSLSRSVEEGLQQRVSPQSLFSADKGIRNQSVLSAISVLPFSRLFLVGTEDGFLKSLG
ncbi:hypothetical protein HPP92_009831 [Vanilla planifolia]|uniref:BEACH domain-containing protein n=1 Tax=Vanilla planifolia TaxID=51239 RepID=A0A835V978_VANPL|nr:hypothetical protein HPP92_009831 [Vanilla planifolia]